MNKKGMEVTGEHVIFIVLNTIFFVALLVFLWRSASNESIIEENYAKSMGLSIDRLNLGGQASFNIAELKTAADKNKITGAIKPDFTKNTLNIRLISGTGYTFDYFSPVQEGNIIVSDDGKSLTIKSG